MNPVGEVLKVMKPLEPVPTGVEPRLPVLDGIRAVVFDIYGTLLISGAGDNSLISEEDSVDAMADAVSGFGKMKGIPANQILRKYRQVIARHQEIRRGEGIAIPEVDIREVWKDLLSEFGESAVDDHEIERVARAYEYSATECWEMPGARELLDRLAGKNYLLGVVSNAQFYTLALVEAFLGISLNSNGFTDSFNPVESSSQPCWVPEMTVWSYRMREGKPSEALYRRLRGGAKKNGLNPEEILYIGNDFCKDVAPAKKVGFRTGLFAGDARSFRPGPDGLPAALERADVVLTELRQVDQVLAISGI